MQACKEGYEMRMEPLVPTENVVDMIKTVLGCNVFGFDNTIIDRRNSHWFQNG